MGREGDARANPVEIQPPQPAPPSETREYEGLFQGLGVSSKEPVCSKRSSQLSALHQQTHFAYSCKEWEKAAAGDRLESRYKITHRDPGMVFGRVDVPYKNASVVELRQGKYNPAAHFRTEQRERFADRGPQPRQPPCEAFESQVHFGDDEADGYLSQSTRVHTLECTAESGITPASEKNRALRGAGVGAYIDTNPAWPRPRKLDPVTGGPPMPETAIIDARPAPEHRREYVQGEEPSWYPIKSANYSAVNMDVNPSQRNPILGVYQKPFDGRFMKTEEIIALENGRVPPLRSLGAVRPITHEDARG